MKGPALFRGVIGPSPAIICSAVGVTAASSESGALRLIRGISMLGICGEDGFEARRLCNRLPLPAVGARAGLEGSLTSARSASSNEWSALELVPLLMPFASACVMSGVGSASITIASLAVSSASANGSFASLSGDSMVYSSSAKSSSADRSVIARQFGH